MWVGDLEGDGLLDTVTRIWCGVWHETETGEHKEFGPDDIGEMLDWLSQTSPICMHNGIGYDIPVLEKCYGFQYGGTLYDSLVVSRLQNPNRSRVPGVRAGPHSVESWGARFGRAKPGHEDWSQFSEEMLHRCREDVAIQCSIYRYLEEEAGNLNWATARKQTQAFFELMHKQEEAGWLLDIPYLADCIATLTRWMDRIENVVIPRLPMVRVIEQQKQWHLLPFKKDGTYKQHTRNWLDTNGFDTDGDSLPLGGSFSPLYYRDFDLGKTEEVKSYLLGEGWIPKEWNTNDDGERTSPKLSQTEEFEGVAGKEGRLIAKWFVCRHRRSQLLGWIERKRDDNRLPQVITGLTETYRLTHANIVNVPGNDSFFGKRMRRCFIAKPGYVIVGTDSAACQNRMLAARVGDDQFTETILRGDKDAGTSIHQVNQKAIKKVAGIDVTYKTSKNLNYAFMFGASVPKLGRMVAMGPDMGEKINEALLSIAPGLKELRESLVKQWRSTAKRRINKWGKMEYYGGHIIALDGRPIVIQSEHTLLVYLLQCDEALMMQYALLYLYKWCTQEGWVINEDYSFVANIHDEFQSEVREDIAERYAELSDKAIATAGQYLKIQCEHIGESDIGHSWADTH